ncbi:MAG: hypothetical protein V4631_23320 [Pseudomonadota bacterium]
MIAAILIALTGLASAAVYCLRHKWIDALLVLLAAAGLAGLTGDFSMPGKQVATLTIESNDTAPLFNDAAVIKLNGDGLRASQWHDLPARKLEWKPAAGDVLHLDFPRVVTPGRMFRLTATMPQAASRRLQLLAENGQVIAEAAGQGAALTVQWMPPVAETLLFKARLLDANGKVLAEGPVPFEVRETAPLQVKGRFGSPSFDANALNLLLANSNAVLDWQVTLGKTVTRSETARTEIARPDLLVADAAYLERLSDSARGALLAQVAAGSPLLVLAANAREPQFWSRTLQLQLKAQPDAKAAGAPLAMLTAPFNPVAGGPWAAAGDRAWSRPWEKGRIVWLGVSEWHRYAISEPQALGVWWQDVLDRAGIRREESLTWIDPEDMPLPGQRLEVCAQGVSGELAFPDLKQTLTWQRRPDKADSACVAVWPAASGWLKMHTGGKAGQLYVYAKQDWPLWQKAQRRDATARYVARTPTAPGKSTVPMPAWPFALLFAAAILLLWWRERS